MSEEENKVINFGRYLTDMNEWAAKAYDFTRDADASSVNDLWSQEIQAWADASTIESLFFTEDWVFITCDLAAGKLASQPLVIKKSTVVNGEERVETDDAHPLNALFYSPNEFQDYHSWMYSSCVQFFLLGNMITWYAKRLNSLITIPTARTTLDFDARGELSNYLLMDIDGYNGLSQPTQNVSQVFKRSEICHVRRPNPASLLWGLSPFVPGRKCILFNRYSTDYLNSFYIKQATPGLMLEMDRQVNETQALRQLRTFELAYTGRRNQRRTLILPKGVKATPVSHSIADQRITELVMMNRETILNLLKVPKHEVGLQDAGSLGSEEHKTALRNFWESTLIPASKLIAGSLTKFFAKELGDDRFIEFDLSDVDALKDDQKKMADIAIAMAQTLTLNEVRAEVWQKDPLPIPQADLPLTLQPVASPFGLPQLPQRPTEPQVVEDTPDEEDVEEMVEETSDLESNSFTKRLVERLRERSGEWVDRTAKAIDDEVNTRRGRTLEELALETLVTLTEIAEPIIRTELRERKDASIPSRKELRRRLQEAFDQLEDLWTNSYTDTLSTSVDIGYDQMVELVFNREDRIKLEALRLRDENRRRRILQERGIESFSNISKTHTERIMKEITKGVEEGQTIDQITRRVANALGDPQTMMGRASTIARTETLTAVSVGQGAAVQNASEVIPGLRKAWLNAGDDRVRDTHLDKSQGGVSGEIVEANEEFSNGLRYPRDTQAGDAGEVINCRCTLVMLAPGEEL